MAKSKSGHKQPSKDLDKKSSASEPAVIFELSPSFRKTAAEKFKAYPGLDKKASDFRATKAADRNALYGSSDKPFKTNGAFSGLRHAHLTFDLSLVYSISGANPAIIRLYGIYSHDELGTGQPPNINRQKSMGAHLKGQTFS